ncbi:PTS fructose transporter subunit IIA [Enterococcus devriesei]|uniref:PTS sugar transporter subunit IIA n=1 Tax=Enterococcus devriesei TaxID=319970 RepID=UPI00288F3AA8|nr:PTS fructose transporter subunit IIA [Enterococcus devriesei]MDT2822993.1 PTS fructose transporter subunit IIA [Enterococcus devriesei]
MRKLIVASHSTLAEGFKETLEFLTGIQGHISSLCAYIEGTEEIDQKISKLLDTSDEVIILTDMAGGSVNQKFYQHISERVHVIAGMNLPLAMSIALQLDSETLDIPSIVEEAQQQIIYMNYQKNEEKVEDE